MNEDLDRFYNRIYITTEKVFVYPNKRNVGKPEIWTLEQKEQYVNYLKQNGR